MARSVKQIISVIESVAVELQVATEGEIKKASKQRAKADRAISKARDHDNVANKAERIGARLNALID